MNCSVKQLLSFSISKNAIFRSPLLNSFSTRNTFLQRKTFVTGTKVPTFNNLKQYSTPLNTKLFATKPNNYFKILQRGVKSYKDYSEPKLPEQYEEAELDDSEKDAFLTLFTKDKKYKEEGKDFYIIRFPETFHEGELLDVKWYVDVGSPVKQNQLLFTLEFDKEYELEINSPVSGHFIKKFMEEGTHKLYAGKAMGVIVFDPKDIVKYSKFFKRSPLYFLSKLLFALFILAALLGVLFFALTFVYYINPNPTIQAIIDFITDILPF